MQLKSFYYNANNITLHVKEGGDASAPVTLFLHGFPAFWHSWQGQAAYFIAKHYRVIVPDQRGYNLSSKPRGVITYRLSYLVADMVQLMKVMKIEQAFIVAHDWGGIVAWALIKQHPQLFAKAVMINAPYLPSYAKFSFAQLVRSWYVYFFQLPWLPEQIMKRNDEKEFAARHFF